MKSPVTLNFVLLLFKFKAIVSEQMKLIGIALSKSNSFVNDVLVLVFQKVNSYAKRGQWGTSKGTNLNILLKIKCRSTGRRGNMGEKEVVKTGVI